MLALINAQPQRFLATDELHAKESSDRLGISASHARFPATSVLVRKRPQHMFGPSIKLGWQFCRAQSCILFTIPRSLHGLECVEERFILLCSNEGITGKLPKIFTRKTTSWSQKFDWVHIVICILIVISKRLLGCNVLEGALFSLGFLLPSCSSTTVYCCSILQAFILPPHSTHFLFLLFLLGFALHFVGLLFRGLLFFRLLQSRRPLCFLFLQALLRILIWFALFLLMLCSLFLLLLLALLLFEF
mmetsp:Transcript_17350/g.40284  ORF Transcript_17350/g.40284 Transcript_17350/m.40284 type:complete len:246 (+) Transcript_17350:941-1678(+)